MDNIVSNYSYLVHWNEIFTVYDFTYAHWRITNSFKIISLKNRIQFFKKIF